MNFTITRNLISGKTFELVLYVILSVMASARAREWHVHHLYEFMPHRTHEMRAIAVDDPVAWTSVNLSDRGFAVQTRLNR